MYLSSLSILGWFLLTLGYVAISIHYRRLNRRQEAQIKSLEKELGKLKEKGTKTAAPVKPIIREVPRRDPEFTITTKLAT